MPVFAVTTAKGVNWDHARDIREQPFALLAVEAADESAVYAVFDADPWTVHHVFRVKSVWPWTLWLDGRGG
jgi:uncharacterized protein YciI